MQTHRAGAHALQIADSVNLEPGQILSGTLRIVRRIAEGGMGSIWMAEHLVLGTEVAIKVMARSWALAPGASERFLREARMTAHVRDPHVVRVLDCRRTDGDEPYLVLELLHGENLEQRVRRDGTLPLEEVRTIVEQVSQALRCAHAEGIIHRDIKPENVFLERGPNLSVKLLDFGIAKPLRKEDWLDVDRLPAGTVQYMSPEHMFDPETTDERSDLFALAAVAYFALLGRPPFDPESLEALFFAMEGGAFTPPTADRQDLPPDIDAWFARALAHAPDARFATADEFAHAFSVAAGVPDDDARSPTSDAKRTGPGRSWARSRGLATAAFALATSAGFWAWNGRIEGVLDRTAPRLIRADDSAETRAVARDEPRAPSDESLPSGPSRTNMQLP